MNKQLYVIGNGFDLHHKINSRYSDFKAFVCDYNNELLERIVKYLNPDKDWFELEAAFAHFDVDTVLEESSDFLMPYTHDDWRDSFNHTYQFEIESIVKSLTEELKNSFGKWIKKIKIPSKQQAKNLMLNIDEKQKFLNFNYTKTLENLYGVAPEKILHIHGHVTDSLDKIVLGHAWKTKKSHSLNTVPNPEDIDFRVYEGNEIIDEYFTETFKPTERIIQDNIQFFNSLSEVTEVVVCGHSLSEVDISYFEKIREVTENKCSWKISYYCSNELNHRKKTMSQLGILPSLVEYYKLSDLCVTS